MNEPTAQEIRLRCIEAASKAPIIHQSGPAAGILAVAKEWAVWVQTGGGPGTLGLPKKS